MQPSDRDDRGEGFLSKKESAAPRLFFTRREQERKMTDYTYIIFDVDGTLINFEKSERRAFSRTMESCGIFDDDELHRKYTDICDSVWEEYDLDNTKDAYIRKNYHQLYRSYAVRRFAELGKELNLEKTPEELSRIYTRYYKEERIPEPKAEEVCRRLSQYYTLVLATNGLEEIQVPRAAIFGDCISRIFVSESVGAVKPSAEFFECICNTLSVASPSECLMVGDSLVNDMEGAAAAGMKTCWYHPGKGSAVCGVNPDYEITALEELLRILQLCDN